MLGRGEKILILFFLERKQMNMNEQEKQTLEKYNSWQLSKHTKPCSDLLRLLKKREKTGQPCVLCRRGVNLYHSEKKYTVYMETDTNKLSDTHPPLYD